MKTALVIAFAVFLFMPASSFTQTSNQWLVTGSGEYTGMNFTQNLAYADAKHFIACGNADGLLKTFVVISNDSGVSWNNVIWYSGYAIDSNYMPLPEMWQEQRCQSVARPSPDVLLALIIRKMKADGNWYPYLLRSTDGGGVWDTVIVNDPPAPGYYHYLDMFDSLHGVLCSSRNPDQNDPAITALYRTTDAGATWGRVVLPFVPDGCRILQQVSPQTVFFINYNGGQRSEDGGATWTSFSVPEGADCVRFESSTVGWAAGGIQTGLGDQARDVIYRTTDGGNTWTKMLDKLLEPAFGLNNIDFADEMNGIAVGQWCKFLHTTDGGNTWVRDFAPYSLHGEPNIAIVRYPSKHSGVALSMSRSLRYTGLKTLLPPTPEVLMPPLLTDYQVIWRPIEGATQYKVQMAEDEKSPYMKYNIFDTGNVIYNAPPSPDTLAAIGSLLKADKDYFVRAKSVNADGESDWSQPIKFTTPDGHSSNQLASPVPEYPAMAATDIPTPVTFQWKAAPHAQRYNLTVSRSPNFLDSLTISVDSIPNLTYTLSLLPNTMYYWYLRSFADGYLPSVAAGYYSFTTDETASAGGAPLAVDFMLSVYPNPAHGTVTVALHGSWNNAATAVAVYDVFGRKLIERSVESGSSSLSLNLSTLPPGIYTVQAASGITIRNARITVLR